MIDPPQNISADLPPSYSIGTLVNDRAQYDAMCASFKGGGFTGPDCEYLASFDPASAYGALNKLLAEARGQYVVLCHQDVRLLTDGRARLDQCLTDLEARDPNWAVAGNAGGLAPGELALRITDPHGRDRHVGRLPARVMSLDENFIVVRRDARIGFSRDLVGFHLYGADICLAADILGYRAYVIDFHLEHLSPGRKDATFAEAEFAFRRKWTHALRPRWLQTTCTLLHIGGGLMGPRLGRLLARPYQRLSRLTARPGVWTSQRRETGPR